MKAGTSTREFIHSLYELYSNDVYRYAWATLGNSSDAYDVVQEVFLRACRSANNYRRDSSARTWLMTIARNYIFDVLRKKRTERKYLDNSEMPEIVDTSTASPGMVLEIKEALLQLNDEYRHVIVLRHIENVSVSETAVILGWSEKKVHNTTHRALLKLREILGSRPEEVKL